MEETSVAEVPSDAAAARPAGADAAADGAAGSGPETAEGTAGAEAVADAGSGAADAVEIPRQQSTDEAAEQESGKGART